MTYTVSGVIGVAMKNGNDNEIWWAKVQKRQRCGDGAKIGKKPTFSKLMNFGPLMVTYLESCRVALHDRKILWAKVKKTAEIWRWGENRKTPTFSEPTNFGPLMVTPLKSLRAGLHDPKIL